MKINNLPSFIPINGFKLRAFLLCFIGFALYSNTLFHDYALDDGLVIRENRYTKQGFAGIKDILIHDSFAGNIKLGSNELTGGRYRPLSLVNYAIEWQFFGQSPHISHFINVLLYCLTGFLLFWFLYHYLPVKNKDVAFLTAFLFIIHPLHTEVVANIKSRDEILCLLFCLAGLIFIIPMPPRPPKGGETTPQTTVNTSLRGAGGLCFFLALLSKETAITYIAIVPLSLYFFTEQKMNAIIKTGLMMLAIGVLFIFIRYKATGFNTKEITEILNNPFLNATISERFASIFLVLGMYIKLLIFPHPLVYDYTFNQIPIVNFTNIWAIFSLLLYVGMFVLAVKLLPKKNIISFAILFFLITISIVSNIFVDIGAQMGERLTYQPSLGFCLLLAWLIVQVHEKYNNPILIKSVLLIVFVLASIKVISRNSDWKNNTVLFIHDVENCPNSARALNAAVTEYINKAKAEDDSLLSVKYLHTAIQYSQKAENIYPTWAALYHDRGIAYYYLYDPENAEKAWNEVKKLKPNDKMADEYPIFLSNRYLLKGIKTGKEKNYPLSLEYLKRALSYDQKDKNTWYNIGLIYGETKQFDLSISSIRNAIALDSTQADYWYNLGGGLFTVKDFAGAKQAWHKTLELKPGHQNAQMGLKALAGMGK